MAVTIAAVLSFSCRASDSPARAHATPFQKTQTYRIESPRPGQFQHFLLKTLAGPATVISTGGIQRGSDLRLELITPVELTLEPGTVTATIIAIGDSSPQVRAVGVGGLEAQSPTIEISSHSIFPVGCCALPKGFTVDASRP